MSAVEHMDVFRQRVGEERRWWPECLQKTGMCVTPLITVHIRDTHLHTSAALQYPLFLFHQDRKRCRSRFVRYGLAAQAQAQLMLLRFLLMTELQPSS